jgi:ABC-type multidrug transport system fused ATPase/permease subunit
VSSALDVTTELELWQALRRHGLTVVGSTSKRAALVQADQVMVLRRRRGGGDGQLGRAPGHLGPPGR